MKNMLTLFVMFGTDFGICKGQGFTETFQSGIRALITPPPSGRVIVKDGVSLSPKPVKYVSIILLCDGEKVGESATDGSGYFPFPMTTDKKFTKKCELRILSTKYKGSISVSGPYSGVTIEATPIGGDPMP
jgi:hypothetical protein